MIEEAQGRQRRHKRIWLALAVLVAILAALIIPPFVSVSRYKAQITQLISTSLGRPVSLSSVKARLLPRPGFVLTNLTVQEDPAYGAEPVLHANTVVADIRLLSLWRGHLEIDTISLDEASLNLVRTAPGLWNLDPILRTAQSMAGDAGRRSLKLPYLEAKNSRINIKNGAEKLPFSLVNAEMSFWQPDAGNWRVRLRGQPVRTDLSLEQADTGVVRLEASLHQAPRLRQMPVHLDLEWRDAQLGQLTRLMLGTDSGWRGNLKGELHLDGTAEAAQVKTQLRATGVHRAEFAPAVPMDFDANCSLVAHVFARSADHLACDSPLGSGHVRLTGSVSSGLPNYTVEMDRIPVAVALDALRTVRSSLSADLAASGTASGKLTYAPAPPAASPASAASARMAAGQPLSGSLSIDGFQLSGGGLSEPIRIPKILFTPAPMPGGNLPEAPQALTATMAIPAGGGAPLTVSAWLARSGYQLTVRGVAAIRRGRELAHVAGMANTAVLDALNGDPVVVDLLAEGPWMLGQAPAHWPAAAGVLSPASAPVLPPAIAADSITGTVTLRNASWKADYLANSVEISQATLHLEPGGMRWDPVAFAYGPVKGTASLALPAACEVSQECSPVFQVQFGSLDAAVLQTASLGARKRGTLLASLMDRLRRTPAPSWPRLQGTIKAKALALGPVTLHDPVVNLYTLTNGAEITSFNAELLGGRVHGSGSFQAAATAQDKPSYEWEGQLEGINPAAVGQLLGWRSPGGSFDGNGKIALSGYTGNDLAASAKGHLHFVWRHGAVTAAHGSGPVSPALARFDNWTAEASIANGALTLKENQVKHGARAVPVQATIPLSQRPRIAFKAVSQ